MMQQRTSNRITTHVYVVIPAASVHDEPRIRRSVVGGKVVNVDHPRTRKAGADEIRRTYDAIESKASRRLSTEDSEAWVSDSWIVVHLTVNIPAQRPRALLARFHPGLLRGDLSLSQLADSISRCASSVEIPVESADVEKCLRQVAESEASETKLESQR